MPEFDHKSLIAGLSPQVRQALLEQSDAPGLRHFAIHAGMIVFGGLAIILNAGSIPLTLLILLMLVQGILICFLFTTLHETLHRTLFKTDALNIWVGRFCGVMTFLGPEWFRYFHFAHHRFTHDPAKDPELASPKPSTAWEYLTYLSGVPESRDRIARLVRNAIWPNEDSYVPARGRAKVMKEARLQVAGYVVIAMLSLLLWSPIVFYVWLGPFLLGAPFLRAYLLAEHARCPNVASMLQNTRTTLSNRLVRFLAWNMPYHVEHHAYPAVPFHKLPAFHDHTRKHIENLQDGYLAFNKSYFEDSMSGKYNQET